ncbi:MAG TPA: hypothetical protein VIL27_08725 [Clostridia bacterium]
MNNHKKLLQGSPDLRHNVVRREIQIILLGLTPELSTVAHLVGLIAGDAWKFASIRGLDEARLDARALFKINPPA